MKGYRARGHGVGTGPAKGAKFKRKQWKQKIAYAKSNFGKECDDDDNFNYNLVGAELPTVAAEGEGITYKKSSVLFVIVIKMLDLVYRN